MELDNYDTADAIASQPTPPPSLPAVDGDTYDSVDNIYFRTGHFYESVSCAAAGHATTCIAPHARDAVVA